MAWLIKSNMDGPIIINDIGLMLTRGQVKDLDLIGRPNAERSNDLKILLSKGYVLQLEKSAYTPESIGGAVDQQLAEKLTVAAQQAAEITKQQAVTINQQTETISKLTNEVEDQRKKTQEVIDNTKKILEAVQQFSSQFPVEVRTMKKAMENIKIERGQIAESREDLASADVSDETMKVQERILANKDKKLEKNFLDLGKAVTKNAVEKAEDVDDALDAMDELGI